MQEPDHRNAFDEGRWHECALLLVYFFTFCAITGALLGVTIYFIVHGESGEFLPMLLATLFFVYKTICIALGKIW